MIQIPTWEDKQVQYIMVVGDAYIERAILPYLEHTIERVLIIWSHHGIDDFSKENGETILSYRPKVVEELILTLREYPHEEIIIEEYKQEKNSFIDRTTRFNHKYIHPSKSLLGRSKKSFHSRKR